MADSTNRIHVSPGVYASDMVDMKAAANSLGVTRLALVGETLKGPAFQQYWVSTPKEYASVFGGTSAEKFKGSNYPKYELPYIANEYLSKSNKLCVIRTLGFSGYNAGPAWLITGSKDGNDKKYVIGVLRSKGSYKFRPEYVKTTTTGCQCTTAYDSLTYDVGETTGVASCGEPKKYNMKAVELVPYFSLKDGGNGCTSYTLSKDNGDDETVTAFDASSGDLGRFTIKCVVGPQEDNTTPTNVETSGLTVVTIPVSLNKGDNDYIENILGTTPSDGSYPLYIESLYDVAWENLVMGEGYNKVDANLVGFEPASAADYAGLDAINGILTKYDVELTKKDLGKRFLYSSELGSPVSGVTSYLFDYQTDNGQKYYPSVNITLGATDETIDTMQKDVIEADECFRILNGKYAGYYVNNTGHEIASGNANVVNILTSCPRINNINGLDAYKKAGSLVEGKIYTVAIIKDTEGIRHYVYREYEQATIKKSVDPDTNADVYETYVRALDTLGTKGITTSINSKIGSIVYNYEDGLYYKLVNGAVTPILCDLNDYKSSYRYSSTPWVVSNAKGDANNIEVNKLFRFHTISDGKTSVDEVKVSIENIRPNSGQFDVVVRDYNDSDASPIILERFSKCTMAQGKKFIGYMIGTIDGFYESKSKYITVEVAESNAAVNSVPSGFLGYTIPMYGSATIATSGATNVSLAPVMYNLMYDEDVNKKKQYFGISDIVGYDYDYFSYKGKMAVIEDPEFMSHGFHLDCRLNKDSYGSSNDVPKITVDGETGYTFDTVSVNARTSSLNQSPIIASEDDMYGSIYEDVKMRKFTMAFAGGFDGWDEYRDQRTNTNEYTASSYKGYINKSNGIGYAFDTFNTFNNSDMYNLTGGAITTDYYSTLAGVSLLKNPEEVDINLLVTPGVDTINNSRLTNDIFEILEDRADVFYVAITPDKESGTGDFDSDVQETEYIVSDFLDQELHSDYAATYYPWVKIEDNGRYVYVSPTKDVVRNMAESDNTNTTQNLSPAGTTRGKVKGIRARKNLKNSEADALYEASINPVRTFSREGMVVMGQKTLREADDLKNRVDVMRCLLRMRKLLSIATLGLVFEPNHESTIKSFRSIVSGVMQTFIDNRAIEKWTMDIDESEEARDRAEINATIYFKPIKAIEYINLNFVVTNKDSYFE